MNKSTSSDDHEQEIVDGDKKLKKANVIAFNLLEKDFKYIKIFIAHKVVYYYVDSLGHYKKLFYDEFKVILTKVLRFYTKDLFSSNLLERVWKKILVADQCLVGSPEANSGYAAFPNGLLDLKIFEFIEHNPEIFTTHGNSFDYDPNVTDTPHFNLFLEILSCGHKDREMYLRSLINCVVMSRIYLQIVIYIFGPGATGKSQLTSLLRVLVGDSSTISTTLNALSSDQFEANNLKNMKMVLVNDSPGIIKDSSLVKAYSGNDELRGRVIYNQGITSIVPTGIIVIVGNEPITTDGADSGNAVGHRLRIYETEKISESRIPLIYTKDGVSGGVLAEELPGIFNSIVNMDGKQVEECVMYYENKVPSFQNTLHAVNKRINSVYEWSSEELEPLDKRTRLGCYATDKKDLKLTVGGFLFPTYVEWCKRKNLKRRIL